MQSTLTRDLLYMSETIFDKIISGEIQSDIVYEDSEVLAFRDISPQAPTHILIIPKNNIPTINDLEEKDSNLIGKLVLTAKKIAEQEKISESGYRLVFNCNEDAGQTVFHIHMHLLAGRKFTWPPG